MTDGILDDSIRHAFDPYDVPGIDERIIRQSPARDLAQFPDFDGTNPVRRDDSQRPRDYSVPMGYGRDFVEKPTRVGCMAIEVPLVSGLVYSMPGALAGWSLACFDPAGVSPLAAISGYFRDRYSNGTLLSYVAPMVATDFANTVTFPFPINFSSLYFDRLLDAAVASYVHLTAYVIPTE